MEKYPSLEDVFAGLDNPAEVKTLLKVLLTPDEYCSVVKRWPVDLCLLMQDDLGMKTKRDIAHRTNQRPHFVGSRHRQMQSVSQASLGRLASTVRQLLKGRFP
jgi:hypothetical protein